MIPKAIMHLINQYNEKGVFVCTNEYDDERRCVCKYYWFNGKRFESFYYENILYDYIMIQIQIKAITHTYILSKNKISHFNEENWKTIETATLQMISTVDYGTKFYFLSGNSEMYQLQSLGETKNHGVIFCFGSCYLIDLDGNLYMTYMTDHFNAQLDLIEESMKIAKFHCSGQWE